MFDTALFSGSDCDLMLMVFRTNARGEPTASKVFGPGHRFEINSLIERVCSYTALKSLLIRPMTELSFEQFSAREDIPYDMDALLAWSRQIDETSNC